MEGTTLCPAVWDNLCINTGGKNRLCCNAVTQDNDRFLDNFDEHWNVFRASVKKEMLNGQQPAACISCWKKEENGIHSLRQGFIEKYQGKGLWDEFLTRLDQTATLPTEIDLKLGNHCNLSCRMCSSYSSSKYAAEFKKIRKDTGIDYGMNDDEKNYVQDDWYNQEYFVTKFKTIVDNGLRELKVTGGEPLMVPNVKKILDYCVSENKSKDIFFTLITNGTLLSQEWIDIFLQFIHTNIIISIDGVKDTYEYIRYPTKWNDVRGKLELLSSINNWKITNTLTFTLQLYNILQPDRIVDLSREFNLDLNSIPLDTPAYLDVVNAPDDLKHDALLRLDSIQPNGYFEKVFVTDVRNKIMQSPADNQDELKRRFVQISKLKDPYRHQDFSTTEVSKYYE